MISTVVLAKNEAANIRRCLEALGWCDDVLVVDDGSTDGTRQIAAECGARVVSHRFESFARQRNWALESAGLKHEWALMLDADEVVTASFQRELIDTMAGVADDVDGFAICRLNYFMDRFLRHADGFPVWIMRVVRRGRIGFEDRGHGEVPIPASSGRILKLREPIEHYPFERGLSDWIGRHDRYAAREAALEQQDREPLLFRHLLSSDGAVRRKALRTLSRRLPGRPGLRFLHQYVLRGGFLDGRAGLAFCQLMAWYEGLIVLKGWELRRVQEEANQLHQSQHGTLPAPFVSREQPLGPLTVRCGLDKAKDDERRPRFGTKLSVAAEESQ